MVATMLPYGNQIMYYGYAKFEDETHSHRVVWWKTENISANLFSVYEIILCRVLGFFSFTSCHDVQNAVLYFCFSTNVTQD